MSRCHSVLIYFAFRHAFVNIRHSFRIFQIVAIVATIVLIKQITLKNEEFELSVMRPL